MSDLVTLNVGGSLYTTTVATLTRYPYSMLGGMFSDRIPTLRDSNGHYIIDRDGPIFRHVLNFLRLPSLCLPNDFKEWDLLSAEADFFQIKELIDAVKSLKEKRSEEVNSIVETTGVQKREFIEIMFTNSEVKYRGDQTTLAAIPFIARSHKQLKSYLMGSNEHLIVVPVDVSGVFERMKMYQEMTELGFSMMNTITHKNPHWQIILFGRNTE